MKRHNAVKKYKCSFCVKTFYTKQSLENHEPTHTGLKRFVCSTCDKGSPSLLSFFPNVIFLNIVAFSLKQSLIPHMECHDGERPFKCDTCGKGR